MDGSPDSSLKIINVNKKARDPFVRGSKNTIGGVNFRSKPSEMTIVWHDFQTLYSSIGKKPNFNKSAWSFKLHILIRETERLAPKPSSKNKTIGCPSPATFHQKVLIFLRRCWEPKTAQKAKQLTWGIWQYRLDICKQGLETFCVQGRYLCGDTPKNFFGNPNAFALRLELTSCAGGYSHA